jgi:hypothetical protein
LESFFQGLSTFDNKQLSNFMGNQIEAPSMEKMTQIFMSLMEANAQRDAPEIQKKEEANIFTKCLHIVLTKQGQADRRKATKYLKRYWMEVTIHKLSAKVAVNEFITLVEPELKDLITRFATEANEDLKTFELKVKKKFRFEDPDRVTAVTFIYFGL